MSNDAEEFLGDAKGLTRRHLLKSAAAVGAGLALAGPASSFAAGTSRLRRSASGNRLIVDLELEAPSFNPLDVNFQHVRWVTDQVHESLYVYQGATIIPLLAEGMPTAINSLNTEVKLKKGLTFHDGSPCTAKDVAATFMEAAKGKGRIWNSHLTAIASVKAVDAHTVRFTFNTPWALLLDKMAVIPILPASALKLKDNIPGTGPFVFAKHAQGESILLKGWSKYRNGAPQLGEILFRFVPDPGARLINLLRGDSDLLPSVPYSNIAQLQKNAKLLVYEAKAPVDILLWVSSKTVPDVRVRRALAYAIDRQKIVDVVFKGHATPGQGTIGPGSDAFEYTKKLYGPKPDLDKARKLLKDSGISLPFSFDYISTPDQVLKDMGVILQAGWAEVGLKANTQYLDLGAWIGKWVSSEWGVSTAWSLDGTSFGKSAEPLTLTMESKSPLNFQKYASPKMDALLARAKATVDSTARNKLFAQASDLGASDVVMLPPAFPNFVIAANRRVQGLPTAPLGINKLDLYPVSISS